jgi:cytochrome c
MRIGPRTAIGLSALAIAMSSLPVRAENALAAKYGCLGCHASATKLVGPAYQDVAAKYAGDKQAVEHLVASIKNGGSGRWGDMAMPPQPQVKDADAKKLAAWILAGAK